MCWKVEGGGGVGWRQSGVAVLAARSSAALGPAREQTGVSTRGVIIFRIFHGDWLGPLCTSYGSRTRLPRWTCRVSAALH